MFHLYIGVRYRMSGPVRQMRVFFFTFIELLVRRFTVVIIE